MSSEVRAAPLAIVTGGTKRVGAAIAARLAREGYALALTSHSGSDPEDDLAAVLKDEETDWKLFDCDLSVTEETEALIGQVTTHFGRAPDLLVNSVSRFEDDDWTDIEVDHLDDLFAVNLYAPVLLARALVKAAPDDSTPCIVHILDQRVRNPNRDQLSYTLSKQALAESVRTLAVQFGARARVGGVAPGLVLPTDDYEEGQLNYIAGKMPLGVLPDPEDIAQAVFYLARARAVTGQTIFVDGGAHLTHFTRDFVHMKPS
ncbi:SDR family oxidoreductase [Novosphingopyxis sp. YJ-S2-01]|uniref:SDR family oxidoreductase n=1 Tax=Novosphingopyxis sp. YJ-S2-01 TaxID=2794021 RepID=UPI0018DD075A|nr:SDR family oxidoreductase [Novosphingopyxis sp. YJ-S2-01]MBH9538657.1 SDR family oxidoreductase [Novosphingopyxis sp. YJ-S2-01]